MLVYLDKHLSDIEAKQSCGDVSLTCFDGESYSISFALSGLSAPQNFVLPLLNDSLSSTGVKGKFSGETFQNKCAIASFLHQLANKAGRINPTGDLSSGEVINCQPVISQADSLNSHIERYLSELFIEGKEDYTKCPNLN